MADTQVAEMWPVPKFHFSVDVDGTVIAFQEVSGLDQETDIIEYRDGDSAIFSTIKQPGLVKFTNITCKKGVYQGDARLTDLFQALINDKARYHNQARMELKIQLLDELGSPVITWTARNCFPVKLQGTDLKSDASEVSIETIEFAIEGLSAEYA
ncbi:MAG: phage tail protein [Chitinophagales bacterium]